MLIKETIDFLRNIPPFSFLDENTLFFLVKGISIEYYPKGYKILDQNGLPSDALRIIKKGAVKLTINTEENKEIVIDYKSEAEHFGFISMVNGDRSKVTVITLEDTLCYLIPKDKIMEIIKHNPKLKEFFFKPFFINKTYEETQKRLSFIQENNNVLYATTIKEIIQRKPVTANKNVSIIDIAKIMTKHKVGSVVLLNDEGLPVGIVTNKDLTEKVIAKTKDVKDKVENIMSHPLIKVDINEPCFEALIKMIRFNIHHVIVVEKEELKGVVSNHDFMLLQGYSPLVLVKEINEQQKIEKLFMFRERLIKVVSALLKEGAVVHNITRLITEIIEKLINKVIDIIEIMQGTSPLKYAIFIYGDGGRRELTLNPKIKLAIVFEDICNLNSIKEIEKYFIQLSKEVNKFFKNCGFILNSSEKVLSIENIKTIKQWKKFFTEYTTSISKYTSDIELLEIRAIRGENLMVEVIKEHLFDKITVEFINFLAITTMNNHPPLGFFRNFVVEKTGEHKNKLNLYLKGIKPLVDCIRIFSLQKGIKAQSTIKRLWMLKEKNLFNHITADVEYALQYLFFLLLHHQVQQFINNNNIDDFINPKKLSIFEKNVLKESFKLITELYEILKKL